MSEFDAMIAAVITALLAVAAWLTSRFVAGKGARAADAAGFKLGGFNSGAPTSSIVRMANAIAVAEGFGVEGAIPTRANNPGNLVIPGWTGATLGSERISVFGSATEGFQRLYFQLQIIKDGRSNVYTLNDTIETMGAKWAPLDTDGNWPRNVARQMSVPITTRLGELL